VFSHLDGTPVMQLPQQGSAYKEIYTSSKWYGLVPDETLLDPAGIVKARLDKRPRRSTVLQNFRKTMKSVVERQNNITDVYHPKTYVAYGKGALKKKSPACGATEDGTQHKPRIESGQKLKDLLTWGKVIWKAPLPSGITDDELRAATMLSDSLSGNLRISLDARKLTVEFQAQKVSRLPTGTDECDLSPHVSKNGIIAGDGTVPVSSAKAQARGLDPTAKGDPASGVQMAFVQGGYNHQFSYNHSWARWALLYSIVQIAQDAPEPSC
jgi:hypothetical protein